MSITLLYESMMINEMTDDVISYLDKHKEDRPFDNMFGDKLRLVIPIGGDLTAREILEDLKSLKDYSGIDIGSGEIIRKIKLDPKYGQGSEKEQKMSIGRAVNALKIDPEKKKKYLDWLAKYKDNLNAALSDISDNVIILSRAPIDVVRMSDHRNISSCHSKGGSYFQCAIQEAVNGGAVAYVVDRDTLEHYIDDLQNDDFFHDSDRGVQGIRPSARLRVRRIDSHYGDELAIPDDRVYGDSSIPGFRKYLNEFLQKYQTKEIKKFADSDGKGWTGRGGSYYDAHINDLTQTFINSALGESDDEAFGDLKIYHSSDDEASENEWATKGWEDELEETTTTYNDRMTYCNVFYHVENDAEMPYIMGYGSCRIDISSFGLPDDADLNIDDPYDIRKVERGDYDDDDYEWSVLIEYLNKKVGSIGIRSLVIDSESIEISFPGESDLFRNPDNYESEFCYEVNVFDNKIDDMLEDPDELTAIFEQVGLIEGVATTNSNYSLYASYMEDDVSYRSMTISGDKSDLRLTWKQGIFVVAPIKDAPYKPDVTFPQWNTALHNFLWNFGREHFKPTDTTAEEHPTFKNFFESYIDPMSDIDIDIQSFKMDMAEISLHYPKYTYINPFIYIRPKGVTNKYFEFFNFLDEIKPHINNFFKLIILREIASSDPDIFPFYKHHNLPNLERLYAKYIK